MSAVNIAFETIGYGPHARDINCWRFNDHAQRHNHLTLDGWKIFYSTVDQLEHHPKQCQQLIQQLLGKYIANHPTDRKLTAIERDLIRLAIKLANPITPSDVRLGLGIGKNHAIMLLKGLVQKRIL